MKNSRRISQQHVAVASHGKKSNIAFFSPIHPNDKKRVGQYLSIRVGKASMELNGTQIRSLRKVLERAEDEAIFGKC